jgi:hypothetical protein
MRPASSARVAFVLLATSCGEEPDPTSSPSVDAGAPNAIAANAGLDAGPDLGFDGCPRFVEPVIGITFPPCRTDEDECGVVLSDLIDDLRLDPGIAECVPLASEGQVNRCSPRVAQGISYPGCCRTNGVCGYIFDLSISGGPDLGCVDARLFEGEELRTCG